MSRVGDRLRRLERRRRPRQEVMYITFWDDPDIEGGIVTGDGERMTATEWERRHPDARVIQLTWGDDGGDVPLTGTFPADIWDNL